MMRGCAKERTTAEACCPQKCDGQDSDVLTVTACADTDRASISHVLQCSQLPGHIATFHYVRRCRSRLRSWLRVLSNSVNAVAGCTALAQGSTGTGPDAMQADVATKFLCKGSTNAARL